MRILASSFVALLFLSACGSTASYAPPGGDAEYAEVMTSGNIDAAHIRSSRASEFTYVNQQSLPVSATDRKLIRNASLDVTVRDENSIELAMEQAVAVTERLDGYVASESPGRLQLRIPDRQLDAALDELSSLGKVARRDVRADDVTMQYADLEIRLANARALQTRLRALLDDAESVDEVLAVEVELARVTAEVERLEGQIRFLSNQISYSTVVFTVRDRDSLGPLGYVVVGTYEAVKWLFVRG